MIAVTFALPQESQDFAARLSHASVVGSGSLPILLGTLDGLKIIVAHMGVGPESAAVRMELLLSRCRPRILISTGFAGALDTRLQIGDIVVSENFSDVELLKKVGAKKNAAIFFGELISRRHAVETAPAKSALARETKALAVDMETQTIFEICAKSRIPMLSVRGISDTATQSLPIPFAIWFDAKKQQPRAWALVRHLCRHPGVIPKFVRFVAGVSQARKNLTGYLLQIISAC